MTRMRVRQYSNTEHGTDPAGHAGWFIACQPKRTIDRDLGGAVSRPGWRAARIQEGDHQDVNRCEQDGLLRPGRSDAPTTAVPCQSPGERRQK